MDRDGRMEVVATCVPMREGKGKDEGGRRGRSLMQKKKKGKD